MELQKQGHITHESALRKEFEDREAARNKQREEDRREWQDSIRKFQKIMLGRPLHRLSIYNLYLFIVVNVSAILVGNTHRKSVGNIRCRAVGSVLSSEYNTFNQLSLPSSVNGLESAAFDRGGDGPYVIVADGRILKWKGPSIGFVDFAYTSRNRTKNLCDGTNDLNLTNMWETVG
ncbi:strictosidine synthase-like 11-like protein, partial [Tanacetum coccineum]